MMNATSNAAPEARDLSSAVKRFDRAFDFATEIHNRLSAIADGLEPKPQVQGSDGAAKLSGVPCGSVAEFHAKHDRLGDLMGDISGLVGRIERSIG